MKNEILFRMKKHPSLPVMCFTDGTLVRESRRKDARRQTYGSKFADGYYMVKIAGKNISVHRIMAETFLNSSNSATTVDHIDRDKGNNFISNLRWATSKVQADNRDFVINRSSVSKVRACEDLTSYTRERRKYVRETGHGYGRPKPIDDEQHRKSRERNKLYRERHKAEISERNHAFYLKRRYGHEGNQ